MRVYAQKLLSAWASTTGEGNTPFAELQSCRWFSFISFLPASEKQLISKAVMPAEKKTEEPDNFFFFFLLILFKGFP